jgi:RNA polymerase sigma-70 factor (ECF subfamily)
MAVVALDALLTDRFAPDGVCVPAAGSEGALPASAHQPLEARQLFMAHYASVRRLLRRFGVATASVDDAAQEVFWVAVRRLADIRAGSEKAFLYGVALRVASNEVRRQNATEALSASGEPAQSQLVDLAPTPEESLAQRRALQLLQAALDQMPLELRTVFVLFELEGLEVAKIAELEELPVGTASSRLRRARSEFSAVTKRLRATLDKRGGQP